MYVSCKKCKSLYEETGECGNCRNARRKTLTERSKEDHIMKDYDSSFKTFSKVIPQCPGPNHPCELIQSTILADIPQPKHEAIPNIRLSSAQQDVVTAAIAKFMEPRLKNGLIKAFFIGNGTGTGKGRDICGVIIGFSLKTGATKHIWISASGDLFEDAMRDMADVTDTPMKIFNVYDKHYPAEGILFTTYKGLVARYKRIVEWFGHDTTGVIAMDECHKAKGVSQTNKAVVNIQIQLKNTAVLYLSATGCSQYKDLTYMNSRLEIFEDIEYDIKRYTRSVSLSEIMALELYMRRAYVAHTLSMEGVSFNVTTVKLTEADRSRYNQYVKAVSMIPSGHRTTSMLIMRYVIMSIKIKHTIDIIRKALADGFAVVVSLTSTGESHQTTKNCVTDSAKMLLSRVGSEDINELLKDTPDVMNPLDTIVNEFGEANVAELTGRSHRWVGERLLPTPDRLDDKRAFLADEKQVAIISEASAAGISLHASPHFKNQKRRFMVAFELPWSEVMFSQQCGRIHRSNQLSAPHYEYVVTDLPGEIRYSASITKRLKMMGAIMMGNRDCNQFMGGVDAFDYDNKCGRLAAKDSGVEYEFSGNCESLEGFFNELIRKPVELQSDVMEYFRKRFEVHKEEAQLAGTYDVGVREIRPTKVRLVNTHDLKVIKLIEFDVYNHAPVDMLLQRYPGGEFGMLGKTLVYRTGGDNYIQPWRTQPKKNTSRAFVPMDLVTAKRKWELQLSETEAKYVKRVGLVTGCVLAFVPEIKKIIDGPIRVKRLLCGDIYQVGIALESESDIRAFKKMFAIIR